MEGKIFHTFACTFSTFARALFAFARVFSTFACALFAFAFVFSAFACAFPEIRFLTFEILIFVPALVATIVMPTLVIRVVSADALLVAGRGSNFVAARSLIFIIVTLVIRPARPVVLITRSLLIIASTFPLFLTTRFVVIGPFSVATR